jgi:hypothetical protein
MAMAMDSIEFSVARVRMLLGERDTPAFMAEIAFLYDHIVKTGTHEPVIDLGMKLMIPFDEVGAMVADAMENGYIAAPKRGTWGGTITNKSLKILGQVVVQKRRKRIDSLVCPNCGEKTLKKIVYGMPGEDFDFQKNFVGGCIPGPEDIGCKNCEWVGMRDVSGGI